MVSWAVNCTVESNFTIKTAETLTRIESNLTFLPWRSRVRMAELQSTTQDQLPTTDKARFEAEKVMLCIRSRHSLRISVLGLGVPRKTTPLCDS